MLRAYVSLYNYGYTSQHVQLHNDKGKQRQVVKNNLEQFYRFRQHTTNIYNNGQNAFRLQFSLSEAVIFFTFITDRTVMFSFSVLYEAVYPLNLCFIYRSSGMTRV